MGKTFVLVHGSWHGGWAWEAVTRELSAKGHRAHAPTLSGHGPRAQRSSVSHQDCANTVVSLIQERRLTDVILVGHSFGGTVVQKVAERLPHRIARTVFLDALILEDNESVRWHGAGGTGGSHDWVPPIFFLRVSASLR